MAFRAIPAELIALFERNLPIDPRLERRQMFGSPCAFAGGAMFMGAHEASLFLRLSEADRAHIMAANGAQLFDPMGGRPMREYVVLPDAIVADGAALADWIGRGFAYALTVPARNKRAAKRK